MEKGDQDRFLAALKGLPRDRVEGIQREQSRKFFVELDRCHGSCVLKFGEAHGAVAEALEHFCGSRIWLGDYVVMPNHVHAIVQPYPGVKLEEWLYSVKRFSATQILKKFSQKARKRAGHLWQAESFDRVIRDLDELARTRDYIANNPRKLVAGTFVYRAKQWLDTEFARK